VRARSGGCTCPLGGSPLTPPPPPRENGSVAPPFIKISEDRKRHRHRDLLILSSRRRRAMKERRLPKCTECTRESQYQEKRENLSEETRREISLLQRYLAKKSRIDSLSGHPVCSAWCRKIIRQSSASLVCLGKYFRTHAVKRAR